MTDIGSGSAAAESSVDAPAFSSQDMKDFRAAVGRLIGEDVVTSQLDEQHFSLGELMGMIDVSIPVGISVMDETSTYVLISSRLYKMLGVTPDEVGAGDTAADLIGLLAERGILDRAAPGIQGLDAAPRPEHRAGELHERIMPMLDGRSIRLSRVKLPNGYTVDINEDVTDLITTQELLEDALEMGQSGYWTYDFETDDYRYSDSLAKFLGPEGLEQALREGPISSVHTEDREAFKAALASLTEGEDSFQVVTRSVLTDRPFWFESTGKLHRFPDGRPHQLRCHTRNVTQEHMHRQELARAKDEAVAASRAKSQFLANMSHEIRTPMNGVLGMAELLAGSAIDDRQREFVNVITRSATSLLTVINDILDFSKIEADALHLDPHPLNLRDLVEEVTTLLSPNAADKGLELVVDYPSALPSSFVGDATRIRQVLTNLVGNAIKFTETGHVLTRVGTRQLEQGRVELAVDVVDTGIGIETNKLERVFDKFTQADNSTTRIYGGTGLGLSIAKRLAELMDGSLEVSSVYGEGTTFTFRAALPLDKSAKPVVRNTGPLRGRRVLIVDDIDVNRRVLSEQLGGWGMKTQAVADGVEALLALKTAQDPLTATEPFDMAILDYLMPGVNGRELASMMEAQGSIDVPVLMLSSCDQQQVRELDSASGIDRYLVKPVREQALFDAIVDVLYDGGKNANSDDSETAVTPPIAFTRIEPTRETRPAPEPTSETPPKTRPAPASEEAPEEVEPTRSETRPGKTEILVAEDFPLNQDVVRLMLADTRYQPVIVADGSEAVELFTVEAGTGRFAAVLMDISMPVMDGYTATDGIRRVEAERDCGRTPIIALTGHALTHEREKCLEAGMDDYLTKPVKQVELIAALDRWTGFETKLAVAG